MYSCFYYSTAYNPGCSELLCFTWNVSEVVMVTQVNPYRKLVDLLETRLKRQEVAMAETQSQLEGARKSCLDFDAQQMDLLKPKGVKS